MPSVIHTEISPLRPVLANAMGPMFDRASTTSPERSRATVKCARERSGAARAGSGVADPSVADGEGASTAAVLSPSPTRRALQSQYRLRTPSSEARSWATTDIQASSVSNPLGVNA